MAPQRQRASGIETSGLLPPASGPRAPLPRQTYKTMAKRRPEGRPQAAKGAGRAGCRGMRPGPLGRSALSAEPRPPRRGERARRGTLPRSPLGKLAGPPAPHARAADSKTARARPQPPAAFPSRPEGPQRAEGSRELGYLGAQVTRWKNCRRRDEGSQRRPGRRRPHCNRPRFESLLLKVGSAASAARSGPREGRSWLRRGAQRAQRAQRARPGANGAAVLIGARARRRPHQNRWRNAWTTPPAACRSCCCGTRRRAARPRRALTPGSA